MSHSKMPESLATFDMRAMVHQRMGFVEQSEVLVVGHFSRQPRIVILSEAKNLGSHSLYSKILRRRLRMTRGSFNLTHYQNLASLAGQL